MKRRKPWTTSNGWTITYNDATIDINRTELETKKIGDIIPNCLDEVYNITLKTEKVIEVLNHCLDSGGSIEIDNYRFTVMRKGIKCERLINDAFILFICVVFWKDAERLRRWLK